MLSLSNIKPAKNSARDKKRIGRGNASGHGTYSTRGIKGQRSRTGGSNKLKRLGFKKILAQTPKNRGFKSDKAKNQVVNIKDINQKFADGDKINALSLLKTGLIGSIYEPVKVLGEGELKLKNLEFQGLKLSQGANLKIQKLGGKISSK